MSTSRPLLLLGVIVLVATLLPASPSQAQALVPFEPVFRTQDHGAIVLAGNASLSCPEVATGCPAAREGSGTAAQLNNNHWAMTHVNVDPGDGRINSSSADLAVPPRGQVLYAGLAWGARTAAGSSGSGVPAGLAPSRVQLRTPASPGYVTVQADRVDQPAAAGSGTYQAYADVTDLVRAGGTGTYTGANIAAATGQDRYAGWTLIVVVQDPGQPLRQLTVFRGFDAVSRVRPAADVPLTGFLAPPFGAVRAELGVVGYEGDRGTGGDTVSLNGVPISDAANPPNNFFNTNVTRLGQPVLSRAPAHDNTFGYDAGTHDVSGLLPNGATSATVSFSTTNESYFPGVLTSQIDLYAPAFSDVTKTVVNTSRPDDEGTAPGDTLEVTLTYTNTGSDPADATAVRDPLPDGLRYVPGTIEVLDGPPGAPVGPQTDDAGDDAGRYDAATRTVAVNLGRGADGTSGGSLLPEDRTTVRFRVAVDLGAAGTTVGNRAFLDHRGRSLGDQLTHTGNLVAVPVLSSADLGLTAAVEPDPVTAGERVTTTLSVDNAGPSPATDVTLTGLLPDGVAFDPAASSPACRATGDEVVCDVGDLAVGAVNTATIVGQVDPGTATGTVLSEPVRASAVERDPDPSRAVAVGTTTVTTRADLGAEASVPGGTATAGASVPVEVVVENAGPSTAQEVALTLPLPPRAQLGADTDGRCVDRDGVATCDLGDLAPSEDDVVALEVIVPPDATGDLALAGSVRSQVPDPDPDRATFAVTVPLGSSADLAVSGEAEPAVAGSRTTTTLEVANAGPSVARELDLGIDLPDALSPVSISTDAGSCDLEDGGARCDLGDIGPDAEARVVVVSDVDADVADGSELPIEAAVTSATADPDPGGRSTTVVVPVGASADLQLQQTGPDGAVTTGDTFPLDLEVRNAGPSTAADVVVTQELPDELAAADAVTDQGTCAVTPTTVTCDLGAVPSGTNVAVEVVAEVVGDVAADDTISVRAEATSATPDPRPGDAVAETTINLGPAAADVGVAITVADATPVAGGTTDAQVEVRNAGPNDAQDVVLEVTTPAGSTAEAEGCTGEGATIRCELGSLAPGTSVDVPVTIALPSDLDVGPAVVTAQVETSTPDPTASNDRASAVVEVVAAADLSVDVDVAEPEVIAGEDVDLVIEVGNDGPSDASEVVVAIPALPGGLVPGAAQGRGDDARLVACRVGSNAVFCRVATLPSGDEVVIDVDLGVAPSAPPGAAPVEVVVDAATPDPTPDAATDTGDLTIDTSADLSAGVTLPDGPVPAGTQIPVAVEVSGGGPSDAEDTTVEITLPEDVDVVTVGPGFGACTVDEVTVTCTVDRLPADADLGIDLVVDLPPDREDPLEVEVEADATTPDPDPDSAAAGASVEVEEQAQLVGDVIVAPAVPLPGGEAVLIVGVGNAGPSEAEAVTVEQDLPAELTPSEPIDERCTVTTGLFGTSQVTCDLGDLGPGDGTVVAVPVDVADDADETGVETEITSPTPGPNGSDGDVTIETPVDVRAEADLEAVVRIDGAPIAGDTAVIEVDVVNDGPSPATDVEATVTLPDGATPVDTTVVGGDDGCATTGTTVTCELGDVPAGEVVTIIVDADIDADTRPAPIEVGVEVTSPTPDPEPGSASDATTAPVQQHADLQVEVTTPDEPVAPGDRLEMTVDIDNEGPSDADEVIVSLPLPPGTELVAVEGGAGQVVIPEPEVGDDDPFDLPPFIEVELGTLPADATAEVVVELELGEGATDVLEIVVEATSPALDPDPAVTTGTVPVASDGAQPDDPGDPAVPSDPADPTVPGDPTVPSDPTGPDGPTGPEEREDPAGGGQLGAGSQTGLPRTGEDLWAMVAVALALLTAGAVSLRWRRDDGPSTGQRVRIVS